jgi:hypothetical protein
VDLHKISSEPFRCIEEILSMAVVCDKPYAAAISSLKASDILGQNTRQFESIT